ncbi:MAG TPA: PAS domain-containing sensor histidine kinase [Rhizomicrobium sp.]|nr:PAS domain-containing sensor histidine kinase [Rhizomicrobium sp.]
MEDPEWRFGILIVSMLATAVFALSRAVDPVRQVATAGERSYRAFFEHAIAGIFRTTQSGYYLDANPALARIYGYENREALMSGLTDIAAQLYLDPGRRSEFQALMQKDDRVTDFVSRIRRRDGSVIWISENARAVRDWQGNVLFYEGTVEDVTAKIEGQHALRRALQEAEEASRSKSAFLAAMSHELKTPLNAILGFSEMMKGEVFGPMSATYREYAGDIYDSGTRLHVIINDILEIARLQGGAITLASRLIGVRALIEDTVRQAKHNTGDARDVTVKIAPNLPAIDVDPSRFRLVLTHLVSNALKFTPAEGRVSVSAQATHEGGLVFEIADTGIGMSPQMIAHAMEPFRQLDNSLARRFEGTGLGLPIAHSLVTLHGGSLRIESAEGRGTRVFVTLPSSRVKPRELSLAG